MEDTTYTSKEELNEEQTVRFISIPQVQRSVDLGLLSELSTIIQDIVEGKLDVADWGITNEDNKLILEIEY